MADANDIARYRENLQGEVDAITVYLAVAEREPNPKLAEVYRRLADVEDRHARLWEEELRKAGMDPGARRPSGRARVLAWLARRVGPHVVVPVMAGTEAGSQTMYDGQPEAQGSTLPADERSHARVLNLLAQVSGVRPSPFGRVEGRHRTVGGNALRAAVLGGNDGLVSNLSLIMGVAGAQLSNDTVLLTGVAGLLAGACSMAIGEWVSVQSSRELSERQLALEAEELVQAPKEEEEELALIYQAKGLEPDQAHALARRLMSDPVTALDTLAREELGIDPQELGGSAREAAITSFLLFAVGAVIPLAPFLLLDGAAAVWMSLALSSLGLFGIGAAITLLTGRPVWPSGLRQLAIGLGAAGLTFVIGRLLGVTLAG